MAKAKAKALHLALAMDMDMDMSLHLALAMAISMAITPELLKKLGMYMDIERLRKTIKSNLVSFNLSVEDIERITELLLEDILEILDELY